MYPKFRKFHLIGIGGIGMSGIAQLLRRHGYEVAGSDLAKGDICRALEAQGIEIFLGHHAVNVRDTDVVVYSSAVSPENPELVEAKKRNIPCIPRAEMLAELMRLKYGIAIAGAHGKTTTTSMSGWILKQAGLDPTIVVGGRMDNFGGTNACLGQGEFMVVEADESDGSFNRLNPSIAIVTNVDNEHLDHYGTFENVVQAFQSFLEKIPFYGVGILCADDDRLKQIAQKISRRLLSYGFEEGADYVLSNYHSDAEGCAFDVTRGEEKICVRLSLVGRHNALNAVAALALADELGIDRKISLHALKEYRGVQRRFQFRGEKQGTRFYDDYAHHPTEIRATLAAARERFPQARLRVLFQPHRYSRVSHLWKEFIESLEGCDEVGVAPIYAAGEKALDGVSSEHLVQSLRARGNDAFVATDPVQVASQWLEQGSEDSNSQQVVLTLGAGDLPKIYAKLF